MERDSETFNMHVRLFNRIAEFTYKLLNEEELTEEQKSDPEVGHLIMITILRFAAKLAVKLGLNEENFIDDAIEMFGAEQELKEKNLKEQKTKDILILN